MLLSTKGRYAVMAMVDLATQPQEKPVALAAIAERQEIPLAYLEQIFSRLKRQGLVQSTRGPGGGYRLSHAVDDTLISDIIIAADESITMTRCGGGDGCMAPKTRCLTHDLWEGLGQQIYHYLHSVSLGDVVARRVRNLSIGSSDAMQANMLAQNLVEPSAASA
jgi:Rrf2 family iron-sulfur cluster assembly transcriptional regulator